MIQHFVSGLHGDSNILSDVIGCISAKRDNLDEGATPISVVVAKCADQVVGVAVLRDEQVVLTHSTVCCRGDCLLCSSVYSLS